MHRHAKTTNLDLVKARLKIREYSIVHIRCGGLCVLTLGPTVTSLYAPKPVKTLPAF